MYASAFVTPPRLVYRNFYFYYFILPIVNHSFTKYRATVYSYIYALTSQSSAPVLNAAQKHRWLPLTPLDTLAFSAGHRKIIESLKASSPAHISSHWPRSAQIYNQYFSGCKMVILVF